MLPAIFSLAGTELTGAEKALFRESNPAGFILFGRNIESRNQLRALTSQLRDCTGRDNTPVLIDQEGGRVARLGPPHWQRFPPAASFADRYSVDPEGAVEAIACNYEALGHELAEVGINVDCAPVIDVPVLGAHDVIGDRALGNTPEVVIPLARAALTGLARAGVVGVVKHIPGHGRAAADSHQSLPVVDATDADLAQDLAPFAALRDAPMAMTAHVRYDAWDREHCATLSPVIIREIIRERVGFDGLLISDDLDMKALNGEIADLANRAIVAGCDLALNCWGKLADMQAMADSMPEATAQCTRRLKRAMMSVAAVETGAADVTRQRDLIARRDELLNPIGSN